MRYRSVHTASSLPLGSAKWKRGREASVLPCTLEDLGIDVSTGPVVDFRLAEFLRDDPQSDTLPLIYPIHCRNHCTQIVPIIGQWCLFGPSRLYKNQ